MAESSDTATRRAWMLLAPLWAVLGVFLLVPLTIVLIYSFGQRGPMGGVAAIDDLAGYIASGAFLDNFRRSLDPLYLKIFWRSAWMAMLTTALCLLISYPAAYYIALLARRRVRGVLLAMTIVPFWTSFLIRTYAWILILRTEGLINNVLLALGVIAEPLDVLYNPFAVMVGLVYGELPFMILPIYASLEKLDRSLLEASADLGAHRLQAFARVTLPLSMPGVVAGMLLVFVPAVGQFIVSDLLGGARTMLIGNLIENQFRTARDQPFGSALAVELTLAVLAVLLLYAWYSRRRGESVL